MRSPHSVLIGLFALRFRFHCAALAALLLPILHASADQSTAPTSSHHTRGLVRKVLQDKRSLVVRHDAIPNYMPAMTMELKVLVPAEMEKLKAGDWIEFRLNANQEKHWIDQIKKIPAPASKPAPEPAETPSLFPLKSLKPGDTVPDTELIDESGRAFPLSSLRGTAVALTFIFTRCPLPDFCPLMNRNFSRARSLLQSTPASPTNILFLSISFDSAYDTPEVLQKYARIYRGTNTAQWRFAAAAPDEIRKLGEALNLLIQKEAGSFSHNLRTVVLTPKGAIHRQLDGNLWKPEDLVQALTEAANSPK